MTTLDKINERGHWVVRIRPKVYLPKRIPKLTDLQSIARNCRVRMRGWDFPHIDEEKTRILLDHIESATDWNYILETWKFYQSGQFLHFYGFEDDWLDQSELGSRTKSWKPGQILGISNVVARYSEIFEFASRLSSSPAGDEETEISIALKKLQGRELVNDRGRGSFFRHSHISEIDEFPFAEIYSRPELIANARSLAAQVSIELLQRFGLDVSKEYIHSIQDEVRLYL